MCLNAFHTTPLCSPNRASIVTGQYASRHGIIDNVARDAASHRLPNYHLELQRLGYETAHVGKWHMGNDGSPRAGYDRWVSFDGHGRLFDPELNVDGQRRAAPGLRDRRAERGGGGLRRAPAREAVEPLLRPQGGAPGRASGRRRHARPHPARRLQARRAPPGSLPGPRVPAAPERAAARGGRAGEAGLGGGLPAQGDGARAGGAGRDPRGDAGGDPPARGHDGLGGRGDRDAARRARAHRAARPHLHPLPGRQRLLLRRARARAGAALRLRRRDPLAVPRALPAAGARGQPARRAGARARHRAHHARARGRDAGPAGAGALARPAAGRRGARPTGARRSSSSTGARTRCPGWWG